MYIAGKIDGSCTYAAAATATVHLVLTNKSKLHKLMNCEAKSHKELGKHTQKNPTSNRLLITTSNISYLDLTYIYHCYNTGAIFFIQHEY